MKKCLPSLLLLCCLLLNGNVLAEDRPPLRIAGGFPALEDEWNAAGISIDTPNYHWMTGVDLLQLDNAPDVYSTDSDDCDIQALKDVKLLADLTGSTVICEAVDRMWPDLQALLKDKEGRIVGVPQLVTTQPIYWRQEAWDAAGLSAEEVPHSYVELLDFAERWAARIETRPEKEVCFTDTRFFGGNAASSYTRWLMDILLDTWEMQAYEAGEAARFDTPEWIALLQRTKQVGERLHAAEPSQSKRESMMPLFWNVQGSMPDGWFNGGREEGYSHTVAFRITREQPVLMRANAWVYLVRADSPYADVLTGVLAGLLPSGKGAHAVEMYREGVKPGEYGRGSVERLTAGWIQDRKEYTGKLSFAPRRSAFLYEDAIASFCQGKLSAEKLAEQLCIPKNDPNQ